MTDLVLTLRQRLLVPDPVLIPGAARSGTTLFGRLIGNLTGMEYEYEPWLLRQPPIFVSSKIVDRGSAISIMRSCAHEIRVNRMLGRSIDTRPGNNSRCHDLGESLIAQISSEPGELPGNLSVIED